MHRQKENVGVGPFRATRLWDEAVHLFTEGMPRKRHRLHMRLFEHSFTGSEALKWFYQALEMNPHFSAVITQDKTHQLLNKFYEEGIFVKVRDSGRDAEHFKLHGLYQMNWIKPQHTARTPLSTTYLTNFNQKSENWIRRSLHKEPFSELNQKCVDQEVVNRNLIKENPSNDMSRADNAFSMSVKNPQSCVIHDKACSCKPWIQGRKVQHPLQERKQHEEKQTFSPSRLDNVWRDVFSSRLQTLLPDLDVSGLLWPCAMIRCQWLENNCSVDDDLVAKLPPWVKASTNRLLQALSDENLNRSVVNLDIEADVSAMEAFFGNLQSALIPADLCALFLRVFLHLEMMASPSDDSNTLPTEADRISLRSNVSTESSCSQERHHSLPPNTCFETAFTSASPVTRIVPQRSVDTLHFHPALTCTLTKRNMSAPKLLEACSKSKKQENVVWKSPSQSTSTGPSKGAKYSTLDGSYGGNKSLKVDAVGGSLPRKCFSKNPSYHLLPSCGEGHEGHHNCGELKVLDKTPPNYRMNRRETQEKHGRSHSGGYVNLALQDSFEDKSIKSAELDLDAAMESLNKLILCSQPPKTSEGFHHVRSSSSQKHKEPCVPDLTRNQSCSSQHLSNTSGCSNHSTASTFTPSSSLRRNSYSLNNIYTFMNSCSSLRAGCEWGWDWGSDIERTGVAVVHLLTLLLPPHSRVQLKLLLKIMGLLPYQCPYTTVKVLEMFSSCIVPCGDEDVTARFLGFMVRHHQEIFLPPKDLVFEVEQFKNNTSVSKERAAVTFCERISLLQFEEQKLTTSQKALAELLDQIIDDEKMNLKEKSKKLKMFKEAYPHIYSMKFPEAESVSLKSKPRSILQLARLRSLRV